jgi:quinol monooxygenase YgiN
MRRRDFLTASAIAIAGIGVPSWATAETGKGIPPFAPFLTLRCRSSAGAKDGASENADSSSPTTLLGMTVGGAIERGDVKRGRGPIPEEDGEARGDMYGMIGKITTVSGKRDAFIAILLSGIGEMPGCLSYVVAKDASDADAIWISEVWDSKESHDASLALPAVKDAIAKGRPLIAGFSNHVVTTPVGGVGLPKHG